MLKCFDIATMVVDEATKQFSPLWKINDKNVDILKQYCEAIDLLSNEYNGTAINVFVDEVNMTVDITLTCEDLTIENKSHIFYQLAERAISVGFSTSDDGELEIKFVFPSLWEKV